MYNWSTDEETLKQNPEKYEVWKLEQTINFGLNGEKINEASLRKHWSHLNLDPARCRYMELLLHGV